MTAYTSPENSARQSYAVLESSYPNFTGKVLTAEDECRFPCKGRTKTLEEHVRTMIRCEEDKRIEAAKRLRKAPYFSNPDDIKVKPGEVTVKGRALGFLKSFIDYAQKKK